MTADESSWLEQLARTPLSERGSVLEALVVAEFKVWLLMGDDDPLPLDQSYFELGLNSLGATEIQTLLVAGLGRPINAASLFNNPTIDNLLTHLRTDVLPDLFPSTPARGAADPAPVTTSTAMPPALHGDGYTSPKDLFDDLLKEMYEA